MFPGMPAGFDPSKLDPRLIGEISQLMATLPPSLMMKMQSLMHNSMAGHDVRHEAAEFEKALPGDFREKMARILYQAHGVTVEAEGSSVTVANAAPIESVDDARLTILRAVSDGHLTPDAALKALFP